MEKEFLNFIAEVFGVEVAKISLNTEYQSIPEWDSLMHLRLVAEIEEKYGVEIPIDDVANIKTLNDIFLHIKDKR